MTVNREVLFAGVDTGSVDTYVPGTDNVTKWQGGPGWLYCDLQTSAATVKLQVQGKLGNWLDTNVDFPDVPGIQAFDLPPDAIVRIEITGTTGTTQVEAHVLNDYRSGVFAT